MIFALALLFIATPSFAETPVKEELKSWGTFSFQGGARLSSIRSSPDFGADWNWFRPLLGVAFEKRIREPLFFKFELNYVRKGYRYRVNKFDTLTTHTTFYDYIDVPLLAKFRFGRRRVNPTAEIGLIASYLAKAERDEDSTYRSVTTNLNKSTLRYDLAAAAGAGLEFAFLPENFCSMNIRYSFGLLNIDKATNIVAKNRGIEIIGGLGFWL